MRSTQQEKGFTLIEIAIVVIIVGVLAAIAVTKFIPIEDQAQNARLDSLAAGLNVASAENRLKSRAGDPSAIAITNCTQVANALPPGNTLPAGFSISSQAIASNSRATCTLNGPGSQTATFIGQGT